MISQLLQDFSLELSVIVQSAKSSCLHNNICPCLQSLDQTSQGMFKRSAGIVRTVFTAKFHSSFCSRRKLNIAKPQSLFRNITDCVIVMMKSWKRNLFSLVKINFHSRLLSDIG